MAIEEIRDKYNKLLGTVSTNEKGFKEVRDTYNVYLAVYDPIKNETRNKCNVVLTKYDSLVSILHEHINYEKNNNSQSKRVSRKCSDAEGFGGLIVDNLVSEFKKFDFSDFGNWKSGSFKNLFKDIFSVRKSFLYFAGIAVFVPILLIFLLLVVFKLLSGN